LTLSINGVLNRTTIVVHF